MSRVVFEVCNRCKNISTVQGADGVEEKETDPPKLESGPFEGSECSNSLSDAVGGASSSISLR
jgi:hypothetical protein